MPKYRDVLSLFFSRFFVIALVFRGHNRVSRIFMRVFVYLSVVFVSTILFLPCLVNGQFPGGFPLNFGAGQFPGGFPGFPSTPAVSDTRPASTGSVNAVIQPKVDMTSSSPQLSTFSDIASSLSSPGVITSGSLMSLVGNLPTTQQYNSLVQGYKVLGMSNENDSREMLFKSSQSPSMSTSDSQDGELLHVSLMVPTIGSNIPDINCCIQAALKYKVKKVFSTPLGSFSIPSSSYSIQMNRVAGGTYSASVQLGSISNIAEISLYPSVQVGVDTPLYTVSSPIVLTTKLEKPIDFQSDQGTGLFGLMSSSHIYHTSGVHAYYSPGQTSTISIAAQDTGAVYIRIDHVEWMWCDIIYRIGNGTRFIENSASLGPNDTEQEYIQYSQLSKAQRSTTLKIDDNAFIVPSLNWRSNLHTGEEQQLQPVCGDMQKQKRGVISVYHPDTQVPDTLYTANISKIFQITDGIVGVQRPSSRVPVMAYSPIPTLISGPVGYIQDVWSVSLEDAIILNGQDVGMAQQVELTSMLRRVHVRYAGKNGLPVEIEMYKTGYKFTTDALSQPAEPVHFKFEQGYLSGYSLISRRITITPSQIRTLPHTDAPIPVVPSSTCLQCIAGCNPMLASTNTQNPTMQCWNKCCEEWELAAFPKILGSMVVLNPELSRQFLPSPLSSQKFVNTFQLSSRKKKYNTFQLLDTLESILEKGGTAVSGQVTGVKGGVEIAKKLDTLSRASMITKRGVRADSTSVTEQVDQQQEHGDQTDAPQESQERVIKQTTFVDVAGVKEFTDKAVVDLVIPEMETSDSYIHNKYGTGLVGKAHELVGGVLLDPVLKLDPLTPRTHARGLTKFQRTNTCLNTGCYASCLGGLEQGFTSLQTTATNMGQTNPPSITSFAQPSVPYITPEYIQAVGQSGVTNLLAQSSGQPVQTPQMLQAMSPMLVEQGKKTASTMADMTVSISSTTECMHACKMSCEANNPNNQQCINLMQCQGTGVDVGAEQFNEKVLEVAEDTEQKLYDQYSIFSRNTPKPMKTMGILEEQAELFKGISPEEAIETIRLGASKISGAVNYISEEATQANALLAAEQKVKDEAQRKEQEQKEKDAQFKDDAVKLTNIDKLAKMNTQEDLFAQQGSANQSITAAAGVQDMAFILDKIYTTVDTTDQLQAAKKTTYTAAEINTVIDKLSTQVDIPEKQVKIFAPGTNIMHALTLVQSVGKV